MIDKLRKMLVLSLQLQSSLPDAESENVAIPGLVNNKSMKCSMWIALLAMLKANLIQPV
jgi:hypothetical protein